MAEGANISRSASVAYLPVLLPAFADNGAFSPECAKLLAGDDQRSQRRDISALLRDNGRMQSQTVSNSTEAMIATPIGDAITSFAASETRLSEAGLRNLSLEPRDRRWRRLLGRD